MSGRVGLLALALLALIGAADATYMTWDHAVHAIDPRAATALCQPGAGCEIARFHPLSEVKFARWQPGVPISLLGLGFYLAMLVLIARRLVLLGRGGPPLPGSGRPDDQDAPRLMLGLAIAAVFYSAFLALVSMAVQGSLCPLCTVMYAVNAALLVGVWVLRTETFTASFKGVWRSLVSWQAVGAAVACSAAVLGGYALYAGPVRPVLQAQYDQLLEEARGLGAAERVTIDTDGRPALGAPNAPVHVVEFADFACGHCRTLYYALHQVLDARPAAVKVTLMPFPLDTACNPHAQMSAHPNACLLARVQDCTAAQDQGELFTATLFDEGRWLSRETIVASAAASGLDAAAFERCLDDPATSARVTASAEQGAAVGVEGTPTFFVNGRKVLGARPLEMLLKMVDSVAAADRGDIAE